MEKLLVVDGSNLLFQMFYGMPARILGPQGQPIQGTLGFVGALLKMIRAVQPTHIAVLFDGECSNDRTQLDPDYKANRPDWSQVPHQELPFSQLPDIYRALECLHIPYAETTCCETDDWIAGYALTFGAEHQMVIASFDSDYFQLITQRVQVLRYRGDRSTICTRQWLQEKLGILPEQYAQYKSLTGDTADNIRGVPGIGPKTAAALLAQFGSLEAMLENTAAISRPAIRAAVSGHAERIRTNYQLIRLTHTAQLPFCPEQLACTPPAMTTMQVLAAIGLKA